MPASQVKIITKLRERRQIEADLRRMLTANSELEFRQQAQLIALLGSQVIPTIIGNLDRADDRMLTAMGTVAAFLDRAEVARLREGLRWVVLQPQSTNQGRMGAITLLERFLGEPPDRELRASLPSAEQVAVSSLDAVLAQAESNPAALVEWVQAMDRQEPDAVLATICALCDRPGAQQIELLWMLAQDVRDEIAAEALRALSAIRLPEAARALQMLMPTFAPTLKPVAGRSLRKLQFAGVKVESLPAAAADWRSLVSPVDGLGQQSVWFVQESQRTPHARFLNVLLSDRAGAVEAIGHRQVSLLWLPPRRPMGELHDISLADGSGAMLVVETSFDVGRRLLVEALDRNRQTQIPVAGVLRLLGPWLWGYEGADSLPERALPALTADDQGLCAVSDRLLTHPAFATWTARSELTLLAAEEVLRRPGWDQDIWVKRLAGELAADAAVLRVLSQRLVAMSEWLHLAGDDQWSRLALVVGQRLVEENASELPFVRALVRRDLELAVQSQGPV